MSLRIITGSTGVNHVTSQDDGSFNQSLYGEQSIVLNVGEKFEATIVDNNTVRIKDGDMLLQGRHARVNTGITDDITIGTGSVDMNRNDLIVARYTLDTTTGFEDISYEVIEGTETSGPATDPAYNTGSIREGATLVDFPLYRVKVEGINLADVEPMFEVVGGLGDIPEMKEDISELKQDLIHVNNNLDSLFILVDYTYASSKVAAGGSVSASPTERNIPDGYRPIAICAVSTTDNRLLIRTVNSESGVIIAYNRHTAELSMTPIMRVLCVKESFMPMNEQ